MNLKESEESLETGREKRSYIISSKIKKYFFQKKTRSEEEGVDLGGVTERYGG